MDIEAQKSMTLWVKLLIESSNFETKVAQLLFRSILIFRIFSSISVNPSHTVTAKFGRPARRRRIGEGQDGGCKAILSPFCAFCDLLWLFLIFYPFSTQSFDRPTAFCQPCTPAFTAWLSPVGSNRASTCHCRAICSLLSQKPVARPHR